MWSTIQLMLNSQFIGRSKSLEITDDIINDKENDARLFLTNGTNHLKRLLQTLTNLDTYWELLANNSKHSLQSLNQIILTLSESFLKTVLQNKNFWAKNL